MAYARNSTAYRDVPRMRAVPEEYLVPLSVHPVQFRDIWVGRIDAVEKELALAVLALAAADLRKFRYARSRLRQRLYVKAYDWVASDSRDWPYSFVNLCEYLQLSPEALREKLLGGVTERELRREAA